MAKKGLGGKGLSALIPDFEIGVSGINSSKIMRELLLDEIIPNKNQPRKIFDDSKLQQLVNSIKEKGVLQPILVQRFKDGYEIIVGERRWRASKKAGLKKIPAVIKETTNKESLELAIIENIHRHDLNPIEEGKAYSRLALDFGMKQEQIAKRVGKNRASIANYMRLLKLSRQVQEDIETGKLSMGHARALLGIEREKEVEALHLKILKERLSVRQVENLVKKINSKSSSKKSKPTASSKIKNVFLKTMEESFERQLGTKVDIQPDKKGGKVIISYFSNEDLERLQECFFSKT